MFVLCSPRSKTFDTEQRVASFAFCGILHNHCAYGTSEEVSFLFSFFISCNKISEIKSHFVAFWSWERLWLIFKSIWVLSFHFLHRSFIVKLSMFRSIAYWCLAEYLILFCLTYKTGSSFVFIITIEKLMHLLRYGTSYTICINFWYFGFFSLPLQISQPCFSNSSIIRHDITRRDLFNFSFFSLQRKIS